jgi:hypothetical protein
MGETTAISAHSATARSRSVTVAVGVAGMLLGWLLAAPMEASFTGTGPATLPYVPDAWVDAYTGAYDSVGEPVGLTPYYFWGKAAFLLYVAGLVVVSALPVTASRRSRVGRRVLLVAFAVGLVGDLLGYWSGWGSTEMGTLTDIGFVALEVPAMLAMLVGCVVLGLGYRADGVVPRWVPWLLVAVVVVVPAFNALLIGYAPHGVLVPLLAVVTVTVAAVRVPA